MNRAEKTTDIRPFNRGEHTTGGAPEGYLMELAKKGVQLHRAGRLRDAENIYHQILQIDAGHADANHLLGGLEFQAGRPDQAIELIAKAIAKTPDMPVFHANLGTVYQSRERWEDALDCYQKALAIKPAYIDAQFGLGNSLRNLGRLREAEAIYREALAEAPDNCLIHNNLGITLLELGRSEHAIACFHRIIAINPDFALAYGNLGKAYYKKGLPEEAIAWHKKALTLDPNLAETHSNLAIVYQEMTLYDDAIASFGRAIALKPDFAHAHSQMGIALKSVGRLSEAVECCQKAVALKPDWAKMHGNLGIALIGMERVEDAIASYHRTIALDPDNLLVWFNLQLAIKMSLHRDGTASRNQEQYLAAFDAAARASIGYTSLEYYLASFKPHQADDSYHKAMANLPLRDVQEVIVDGVDKSLAEDLPGKPIAMLQFGRSGTGLLHSLIDGHAEISTLPSIYLRGYFNPGVWETLSGGGWRELPDRFAAMFAVLFDAKSPQLTPGIPGDQSANLGVKEGMTTLGENRDESLSLDRQAFCAEAIRLMAGLDAVDPLSFLQIVHAAYENVLGAASQKHTMFFHFHNPLPFAKLNFLRYAPDARLLMMVREPIQCCESWVKLRYETNDYGQTASRIMKMLFAIDEVPFRTQESVGVRLEDLKSRPEATMKALCAWMGVKESPSLYEMTAQGKKWWGDPSSPDYKKNNGQSPFDDSAVKRPVGSVFSETDQVVLGTLFYPFAVRFGYREADQCGFERNLQNIRPLLDDMLDFEKAMADRLNQDYDAFKAGDTYRLFRAGLLDRWAVLDELGDYPHMLKPLDLSGS